MPPLEQKVEVRKEVENLRNELGKYKNELDKSKEGCVQFEEGGSGEGEIAEEGGGSLRASRVMRFPPMRRGSEIW